MLDGLSACRIAGRCRAHTGWEADMDLPRSLAILAMVMCAVATAQEADELYLTADEVVATVAVDEQVIALAAVHDVGMRRAAKALDGEQGGV